MPRWLLAALLAALTGGVLVAVPPTAQQEKQDKPNSDAQSAAKRVRIEGDLKAELWASEPLLANPVSFAFDHKGVCYVAETTRFGNGVPDTRSFMKWLDEDIGARSVADRLAMYKKFNYGGYEKFDDQVRRVVDTDGDGKADASTVFAKGFNKPEDGLAAGVLARQGGVYLTNIPSLYYLKDTNGDGVADERKVLSTGYGIRAQFLGHDMHGLRMGPDGKLYFSIGDRGLNVTTLEGKQLLCQESGCVLRCEPDGKKLEIVHTGLRNPQELAFDEVGNLFTYDNNSDSGDRARWVHIVEGGDSGWRCGYQFGTLMHNDRVPQGNRGPWNTEAIWHVPSKDSAPPAYVVPPLKHFGNGPAGITYYPGIGLSDRYQNHFFASDFTSNANGSKVWSLELKPKGASFEVADLHEFARSMVPTDCEFGPDGAFYILDWVGGWDPPGKGRVFRVTDPKAMANPRVAEAKQLLGVGFDKRGDDVLMKLLAFPHREVRQEAQFELASRGKPEPFVKVLAESKDKLPRLHAIWGLSKLGAMAEVAKHAGDSDADLRAAVAKVTADIAVAKKLMADENAHVRATAAVRYGQLVSANPLEATIIRPTTETYFLAPLFDILVNNNDQDVYLRQAAVEGLARGSASGNDLYNAWKLAGSKYDTPAVRMGVVLALRKLRGEQLANFLTDSEPRIVAEAARAIYDAQVAKAMPALAKLAQTPKLQEPVAYRAVAANYKLGTPEAAARVAAVAAKPEEPAYIREFALKLLADWTKPAKRDPITGLIQTISPRSPEVARDAVRPNLAKLFAGPDAVRKEAALATSKLNIAEVGPFMRDLALDANQPATSRVEAVYALDALKAKELPQVVKAALADNSPALRAAARLVLAKGDPKAALATLPALLAEPSTHPLEKQAALSAMAALPESAAVDQTLAGLLDRAIEGKLDGALKLELTDAATQRTNKDKLKLHADLKGKLKLLDSVDRARADKGDTLAVYRDALEGGDAARGKDIFLNNAAVYCQRCHKVDGQGGEVGPVLNGIGGKQPRDYLLEAIIYPNAKIAEGFQSVIVSTVDGKIINGVLRSKDAKAVTVVTPENQVIVIPADDVDGMRPDKSAMPEELHKKISRRELRDLVEFLASLKDTPK